MRCNGHQLHSTYLVSAAFLLTMLLPLSAQENDGWRPGGPPSLSAAATATSRPSQAPIAQAPTTRSATARPPTTKPATTKPATTKPAPSRVSSSGTLPNDHGQIWREYDIRAYTNRMSDQEKPEQAIVDWILRETGTDAWFSETVSLLAASRDAIRVYHTPQIQSVVADIVDRFIGTRAESHAVAVRLVTVNSPDWRAKAMPMLRPVTVQTPGLEAWLLSKENAALLFSDLKRRTDYREHNSPNLTIYNGQGQTISSTQPRPFTRSLRLNPNGAGYQSDLGQVEEGYSLYISPLMSKDKMSADAVVKCSVDQVERLTPIWIDVPNAVSGRGRAQIQVPQMSSWRLHERFRWPAEDVLLISRGVVATLGPDHRWTGAFSEMFASGAPRAEALLFLQVRSQAATDAAQLNQGPRTSGLDYRGRY